MTSRNLTASVLTEIQKDEVSPILLFEGEFEGGTIRMWTGLGDLSWNSVTWTGVGDLVGVSPIEETTEVVANGVSVALSGVDASLVSTAISSARQGKPGRIWVGFLDSSGGVIADPYKAFVGRLDVPKIEDGESTIRITISYESLLADLLRTREWRYTHESQQVLHPGDLGLEYVAKIQDDPILWGSK